MEEIIKKLSIRARVAFINICIESAIKKEFKEINIQIVLDIFWKLTSNQFVDEWLYEVSKVMPDCILEDDYEENEVITYDEYLNLKKVYKEFPTYIFELMECAFECGTIELYGNIENNSNKTTLCVLKAIDISNNHNVSVPKFDFFEKYDFSSNDGWGIQFTRNEVIGNIL